MLYIQIQNDIKAAMKNKETDKRDVLKMALSKAQALAKEQKTDLTDSIMLDGIKKELKQLNQTKDSLAGKETSELHLSTVSKIDVLSQYLPKMLTEEEITKILADKLVNLPEGEVISPKIKGWVMKNVMPDLKDVADGKTISKCLDSLLAVQR